MRGADLMSFFTCHPVHAQELQEVAGGEMVVVK